MENNTNSTTNNSNSQEPKTEPKKCFCARCFLPIDPDDKVEIENQNFHKICGMCCVCRQTPKSLKSFYGHVFCSECFKTHVLNRYRGLDSPAHCNSWWLQWGPKGPNSFSPESTDLKEDLDKENEKDKGKEKEEQAESASTNDKEPSKKCFCARCLHMINSDDEKVDINGQTFHKQCACCCCCHTVPTTSLKIFYGQVFCEECFQRYNVLSQRGDKEFNPDSMRIYFDQWRHPSFVEHMKEFMRSKEKSPMIYLMTDGQPSFCSLGPQQQDWMSNNEKSASLIEECDLFLDGHTNNSEESERLTVVDESATENYDITEKIEKLTKLIEETVELNSEKTNKKWKIFDSADRTDVEDNAPSSMEFEVPKAVTKEEPGLKSPDCLWQCGVIYM